MSAHEGYKKMTVEECQRVISIKFLQKGGFLAHQAYTSNIIWTYNPMEAGGVTFSLSKLGEEEFYMTLMYTRTDECTGVREPITHEVQLVWTPCQFGGRRWWFMCPLASNGVACGRRVSILYLGRGKYFGCRHCYNLTYRSCQKHDKRIDRLIKNPDLLLSYFNNENFSKKLLAIDALTRAEEIEEKKIQKHQRNKKHLK